MLEPNRVDKDANKRARKLELVNSLTQNRYNKQVISYKTKLTNYSTIAKLECLYASECLTLNTKESGRNSRKKKRKILRKILGTQKIADGTWKTRENDDLYKHTEKTTVTVRKLKLKFYGHIVGIDENWLTKIFMYISGLNPERSR